METKRIQQSTFESKKFNIPIEEYEKDMDKEKKNEILEIFKSSNNLRTKEEFEEIMFDLREACIIGDLGLMKIYLGETIEDDSKILKFKIDKTKKTASLFKIKDNIREIIVPRAVKHESIEYLITSISDIGHDIKTLKFVEDSAVKTIYNHAFSHSVIEEFFIPSSLKELKEGWCFFTSNLTKIVVSPSNGQFIMKEDKYLLGKSQENKEEYDILFFGNRDIEEISIPSNIKIISSYAFEYCENLSKIEFEKNSNLQIIERCAFSNTNINEILIPSTVSKICEYVFSFCYNLEKIEFEKNSNLQTIVSNAFSNTNIKEILIPSKVSKICEHTFDNCKNLTKIGFEENSHLQTIDKYAFSCLNIEELFIPSSLKELKEGWCFFTSNLTKIVVSTSNGQFIMKEDKYLLGKSQENKEEYDILFFGNRDIEEILIPSNIKIISSNAFERCTNIFKFEISPNSNLQTIGSYAFSNSNIKEIFIPSTVSKICEHAFDICQSLFKVKISPNSNLQTIECCAFSHTNIKEIFIPSKVSKICDSTFSGCSSLTKVDFEANSHLQTIEKYAFSKSNIKEIFIPSTVSRICENAFLFCHNFDRIEIPPNSNLQTIEYNAFAFSNIKQIFIPSKVSLLCDDAFSCCDNLQIVEISEESILRSFSSLAFDECPKLIIMIPSSLKNFIYFK